MIETDIDNPRVWAYATLMSSEITLDVSQRPNENSNAQRYKIFPAAKIARLAVDKALHGNGYGMTLLDHCISLLEENRSFN